MHSGQPPPGPYGQGPYPGPQQGWPGIQPRRSWPARHKVLTVILSVVGAFVLLVIVLSAAGAGNKAASCTSNTCVTSEIERSLVGLAAKDGAAITKADCQASTVRHNAGNTWSVNCTVTESDGSVSRGTGNWFVSTRQVTYDPQDVITPQG